MKDDNVIVKKSKIHNKGVYAERAFKAGEIVLHWDTSKELLEEKVNKMSEDEKRYVSFLDGKYVAMQAPECYVNHSCEANTTAKQHCDIARLDIKKGDEITADYREELPPDTHMECNCGSSKCARTITS